jgi:hypothetical protein
VIFKLEPFNLKQLTEVVVRWNLDSPKSGSSLEGNFFLSGWALSQEGQQGRLHFVIQGSEGTFSYRMNSERGDVVGALLKGNQGLSKGLMFGFTLPLEERQIREPLRLGFETDGLIQWVATLSIAEE